MVNYDNSKYSYEDVLSGKGFYMSDSSFKYSDGVKTLQMKLNSKGFNCGEPDGLFGQNTKNAVENFQKSCGLSVDGKAGKQTLQKLESSNSSQISISKSPYEEIIWNFLIQKIGNTFGAAGMIGNLYAESGLNPKSLEIARKKDLNKDNESYTSKVDNGEYTDFIKDAAGYGLAQWTYHTRKESLLNYAKASNKSIGDLNMQLEFFWKELCSSFQDVLKKLKEAISVEEASTYVLLKYERPQDQSDAVKRKRAAYGQAFYDKYKTK